MQWLRTKTYFNRYIYVCREDEGVSDAILKVGRWEPRVAAFLMANMSTNGVFLDVGANVGYFSVMIADILERVSLNGTGRVIAVEANPLVTPYLMATVIENGLDHRIQVCPYAVSDRTGLVQINRDFGNNLGGTTIREIDKSGAECSIVPCARLDDILAGVSRIDLVKMDIEGSELLAMKGFERTVAKFSPDIIMELNKDCLRGVSGVSVEDMVRYMQSLGYKPYSFGSDGASLMSVRDVVNTVDSHNYYDFLFSKKERP